MTTYSDPSKQISKKVNSKHNGTLKIEFRDGIKHLNSKNANYSYGALQNIMTFGLHKIEIKNVDSVLLLGLGGGCVIDLLRKDFEYKKQITAVEIDPVVIDIANNEFSIKNTSKLKIICQDALQFMYHNKTSFDLIIVDLFIDTSVPKSFLNIPFWQDVINAKSSKGVIFFNASLEFSKSNALKSVIQFLKSNVYRLEIFEKVNNSNTVILSYSLH